MKKVKTIVAIRGNDRYGRFIIDALKTLGGINVTGYNGLSDKHIYFINHYGEIDTAFDLSTIETMFKFKGFDQVNIVFIDGIECVAFESVSSFVDEIKQRIRLEDKDFKLKSNSLKSFLGDLSSALGDGTEANAVDGVKKEEELIETKHNDSIDSFNTLVNTFENRIKDEAPNEEKKETIENINKFTKDKDGKANLAKKPFKYPKTYVVCAKLLGCFGATFIDGYQGELLDKFQELLICRDAYWKIAGEQMGLGKPWKPDWKDDINEKYIIYTSFNDVELSCSLAENYILAFPTEEMRDAFYENFKELVEQCKELL